MAAGLGVASAVALYRDSTPAAWVLTAAAGGFLALGMALPVTLGPVYGVWMYVARVLGWINTHLLLGLVFYTLFLVVGLGMRLFRYDPLQRRLQPESSSYWQRREEVSRPASHFERQF